MPVTLRRHGGAGRHPKVPTRVESSAATSCTKVPLGAGPGPALWDLATGCRVPRPLGGAVPLRSRLAAVIGLADESRAQQVQSADPPVGAGDREDMLLGKAAPP